MNNQNKLYIEMTNALHKYLNNHGNDEADYQAYVGKREEYKEFLKNDT